MTLKYYLIASEENDYSPWIIRPIALAIFMIIIWALRIFGPAVITFAQSSIDAQDLMNRVNIERTNRFLPGLTTDSRLSSAAVIKSNDMIAKSYFAHVNPDGNYIWPTIESFGYTPYITLGENLAMDFSTASAVVQAWMNSQTHRDNIVNTKFEDQGMGSVFGLFEPGHNSILITNTFGALLNPSAEPDVAPATTPQTPPRAPAYQSPAAPAPDTPKPPDAEETGQATTDETTNAEESGTEPPAFAVDDGIGPRSASIPVSEKAQFFPFYRNIIMTFAIMYLLILALDSWIIYRARIRRANMHSSPHTLIFALIIIVNLFITLY